jgi:hypothetical protein
MVLLQGDKTPKKYLAMHSENSGCYNWGGGAVPSGLKPGILLNLLRRTAQVITKYHLAQMSSVGMM